jgi:hypothetical protein
LDQRRAESLRGFDERVGGERRVRVARIRLIGGVIEMIGGEVGEQLLHLLRRDDRCVDSDFLLVGDIAAQLTLLLARIDLDKPRVHKSAFAADALLPLIEILLITFEG